MTPNLDATSHWWVGALAQLNFKLEYQKGCDNTGGCTNPSYHSIGPRHSEVNPQQSSNGISTLGQSPWPCCSWGWPSSRARGMCPHRLCTSTNACYWLGWSPNGGPDVECSWTGWRHGRRQIWRYFWQNTPPAKEANWSYRIGRIIQFIREPSTYTEHPKGETKDLLLFIVPKAHHVTALNGCHRDAGHQGHDCTLSLWEHFWWPGMAHQMQQSIKSCAHCLQHDGNLSKAPLHSIVATTSMDLLHVDFTCIEMTLELNRPPKVTNVLVFQDHFMKHIIAYGPLIRQVKQLPNSCISVTSQSLEPQLGSWAIGVLTSWAASLMRCVNSSAWRNCGPHHTTHRWMGWWRDHIKPLCKWLGSWEKTERLTGQDTWLK